MTYLAFHFYFLIPQIFVLLFLTRKEIKALVPNVFYAFATLIALALVYTTPWDHYLIYKKVWWYGADRVLGTFLLIPIEEYMFFVLQCIFTGLLYLKLAKPSQWSIDNIEPAKSKRPLLVLFALWVISINFLLQDSTLYLGLILSWGIPIVFIHWFVGRQYLYHRLKPLLLTLAISTVYLWIADGLAIHWNIWTISEKYTIGLKFLSLPLEEATFFFMTNVFIVQSLCLFLEPQLIRDIRAKLARPTT